MLFNVQLNKGCVAQMCMRRDKKYKNRSCYELLAKTEQQVIIGNF